MRGFCFAIAIVALVLTGAQGLQAGDLVKVIVPECCVEVKHAKLIPAQLLCGRTTPMQTTITTKTPTQTTITQKTPTQTTITTKTPIQTTTIYQTPTQKGGPANTRSGIFTPNREGGLIECIGKKVIGGIVRAIIGRKIDPPSPPLPIP